MNVEIPLILNDVPTIRDAVKIPDTNTSPTTASFDVGFVVPIPTEPLEVVVIMVPPTPTFSIEVVVIPEVLTLLKEPFV